ncbi:porin [Pyruvatibacter sp.]|uniref:porin n=1 Tax=Pyruvatibacter sp. TaxID=1981328 RepID=UPI0032EFFEA5
MKKLLGTTALVAAAFATAPAMAADKINIAVGGYFVGGIAAAFDSDEGEGINRATGLPVALGAGVDQRTIRFARESEVHFKGSTTLDNGIEVGVKFELETGETGAFDTMDEAYLWVSGAFGEFQFGAQDGIGDQMPIVAPSPFLETFANDTDLDPMPALFTDATFGINNVMTPNSGGIINTVVDFSGDNEKIIYFTPRIAGFQVGVSYTPEPTELSGDESTQDPFSGNNAWENVFEAGLTWEYGFNGVDVGVSGVYLTADGTLLNTPDVEDWALGASVGFAGFTVGGAYAEKETDGIAAINTGALLEETKHWNLGATYGTGPWTFGLEYAEAQRDEVGGTGAIGTLLVNGVATGAGIDELDLSAWVGGVAYSLGGGANVTLGYKHAEDDAVNREGSALFTEFGVKF